MCFIIRREIIKIIILLFATSAARILLARDLTFQMALEVHTFQMALEVHTFQMALGGAHISNGSGGAHISNGSGGAHISNGPGGTHQGSIDRSIKSTTGASSLSLDPSID
jgi:hypothetical protein